MTPETGISFLRLEVGRTHYALKKLSKHRSRIRKTLKCLDKEFDRKYKQLLTLEKEALKQEGRIKKIEIKKKKKPVISVSKLEEIFSKMSKEELTAFVKELNMGKEKGESK